MAHIVKRIDSNLASSSETNLIKITVKYIGYKLLTGNGNLTDSNSHYFIECSLSKNYITTSTVKNDD